MAGLAKSVAAVINFLSVLGALLQLLIMLLLATDRISISIVVPMLGFILITAMLKIITRDAWRDTRRWLGVTRCVSGICQRTCDLPD